jgi:hypothetical protein
MANPYFSYMGLLERSSNLIHLYCPNDPAVVGYQLRAALSVNDAYGNPAGSGVGGGGTAAVAQVARGKTFRSPRILRNRRDQIEESRRGTTHMVLDLEDYVVLAAAPAPPDQNWVFFRLQENRNGVGLLTVPGPLPVEGPVYVVPPPRPYGLARPSFTLQGIAPSAVVGVAAGAAPPFDEDLTTAAPRPLYLVFPVPLTEFTLRNLDPVNTLLVSFGPEQLMQAVAPGNEVQLYSGSTKTLVLACPNAGGCPYSVHGVLGRG